MMALVLLGGLAGCVNVKAPERIEVGSRSYEDAGPVDPPETATHEEARAELHHAYERIALLRRENERLHGKIDKLEDECDELEDERDDYKKRYERARDRD
jgi:predicted RNase H-like nuclease (RuvC/YqgF family)